MSTCLAGNTELLQQLTLAGGKYLLMEVAETTFDQLERAVYQVRLCGFFPVLAHPERTAFISADPGRLRRITGQQEVFCQLTAASVDGGFGKGPRKTSMALLKMGAAHLVASDAHHASGRRAPELTPAYRILTKALGEERAGIIMFENPRSVLQNGRIKNVGPVAGGQGLLARMRGRGSR